MPQGVGSHLSQKGSMTENWTPWWERRVMKVLMSQPFQGRPSGRLESSKDPQWFACRKQGRSRGSSPWWMIVLSCGVDVLMD